ncbi:MAG TPA: diaminopimelate epimerase [Candidatus Cybelea sp.]|nr:diaminopimelate epimerase [Candidatus Cybelea sp.]
MEPPFIKMHGLGNDFVVLDARTAPIHLSEAQVRAIADRRLGIGCDQIITLENSARADAFMRIHNADGGEVDACGNASRCVATLLMRERGRDRITLETKAGVLETRDAGGGLITVDMGEPRFGWRDIPLAREMDTLHLDLALGPASAPVLSDPVAVNVGNPHAVFFVSDVESVPLTTVGPMLEHHPLFPERVNVEVAQILSPGRIRMRVWERGAGVTSACGTGACATLVAAVRRNLSPRKAELILDGGPLTIEWRDDSRMLMTGPVAESFRGTVGAALLKAS